MDTRAIAGGNPVVAVDVVVTSVVIVTEDVTGFGVVVTNVVVDTEVVNSVVVVVSDIVTAVLW